MTVQMDAQLDVKQRLDSLRQRIDLARQERARAEASLEHARKQREETLAKLAELGVTEEQLLAEIARLESEIRSGLDEAERLLNAPLVASAASGNGVDPF